MRPLSDKARHAAAWLLVGAMLAVQLLGAMHRITHAGHGGQAGHGVQGAAAKAHAPATAGTDFMAPSQRGFLGALFAGHASDRDCDAFDQMSHADAAGAASPDVRAEIVGTAPVVFHPAWHIAAQARGCLARGPPIVA